MKTYNIFISHRWNYFEEYYRLINLLNDVSYFRWKNYSIPPDKPVCFEKYIRNNKLLKCLEDKIKFSSCILIIGGKYINYSNWMQKEIEISYSLNKFLIGILPFGIKEVPSVFYDVCDKVVGWNFKSIVSAIKES
jgi:hypothetical protein